MQRFTIFVRILLIGLCVNAYAQSPSTKAGLKDAIGKAIAANSLTQAGSHPFHIRVVVAEAENPLSPYQGTIEEWWSSPTKWRREVAAKGGIRQTIVALGGSKSEQDEGDYFPLWLSNFVTALFNPIPNASPWTADGATIEQTQLPNAFSPNTCEGVRSKIGTGIRSTDAFSVICFDGAGRLSSVVSPRYSMSFNHYRKFGDKQVPLAMGDVPESGTEIGANVVQLEELSSAESDARFTPLPGNDTRFDSTELSPAKLEELTAGDPRIVWPAAHSGNLTGNLAMYISIDSKGRVREAWPLNSDNAGLDDSAREQVKKWTVTPMKDSAGNPVQMDGPLAFRFTTVKSQ